MVRKLLCLICFIFVAMLLMSANALAAVVDNFEGYSTGDVNTVAHPPWTVSMSNSTVASPAAIALDSGNKYLNYGVPATALNWTYGVSRALPTPILKTDTATTLFLRFYADPCYANNNFGLTAAITPSANTYGDFQVQIGPRAGKFSVRNGANFNLFDYTANTWMAVWAVINQSTSKFDVYLKVDNGTAATVADKIVTGAAYRVATTLSLSFFDALSQGANSNPTALMVKLDDIYLTPGVDLSNPIPEPATITLLGLGGLSLLRIRKRR